MNKYKEYIYNHDIKDTAIKVCSEYYLIKQNITIDEAMIMIAAL